MTCAETIKIILDAGTWTNYGSAPDVLILQKDSLQGSINNRVTLKDIGESPVYAYNNVKIYDEETSCEMSIEGINKDSRDNMFLDVKAIFLASSSRPYIKNPKAITFRNRRMWKTTVILIP